MVAHRMNEAEVSAAIREFKTGLRDRTAELRHAFEQAEAHVRREAEAIAADAAAGRPVVPEVTFAAIARDGLSEADAAAIRRRGCAVIRGVFDPARIAEWNEEIGTYLARNDYEALEREKRGIDQYFSTLASDRPQIFGIYWSRPQVLARQDPDLARTRACLNRLWRWESAQGPVFDLDRECSYADRTRRRAPGDRTLGLSPHMDGGSVERWIDPGYQRVYAEVFGGDWRAYDPFDARHRLETREIPSAAVCSVFRTYQGWTALTRQGPDDGTLRLVPIANGIVYMLLRALQADVAPDDLCGAKAGRALSATADWHPALVEALVSIPEVQPGDTVWWHTDVCHAVADAHTGTEPASVMYIGAAQDCPKNRAYLPGQREAFLAGRSPPDFAAEDYEVGFAGRAGLDDLTPLGRLQMGF